MNAARPTLTSRRMTSAPDAIFLLMMDDAISGIDSTSARDISKSVNFGIGGSEVPRLRADAGSDITRNFENLIG